MFVAPFQFEQLISWFCCVENKYEYLCLFLVGNTPDNQIIAQEILNNTTYIHRVTGDKICFFHCCSYGNYCGCEEFREWNVRNQEELERWSAIRQLFGSFTWKDFSDSFRDEVCSTYRIPRFNLPALVFINKRQEYFLYNVNSYQDIQSLLTSLGIISDYMRDRDDLAFYHKEGEELDKYRLECRKACFNQLEEFGLDSQAVQVVINGVEDNNMQAWLRKLLEACKKRRVDSHAQERGVLKCFIAGAKCLERERDAIVAGVNDYNLANNHSKSRVECHSFKNFDSSISKDGQQHLYNEFIRDDADLCVFVLDENVGGITKEEFDVAVDTFISSGYKRPTILVFANEKIRAQNEDFEEILQRMKDLKQYWVDYSDLENLKLRLHLELHKLYNQ